MLEARCAEINRRHELARDYEKTLALLESLKSGEVLLDQVVLNGDGWQLVPLPAPEAVPPEPAPAPAEAATEPETAEAA